MVETDQLGFGNCSNEYGCAVACPKGIDVKHIATQLSSLRLEPERKMKIHEFQAKELLKRYAIPIQDGITDTLDQADAALDRMQVDLAEQFVIKAQIHAGGRGKGGGVKFCSDRATALEKINEILGMTLITHQTGSEGQLLRR